MNPTNKSSPPLQEWSEALSSLMKSLGEASRRGVPRSLIPSRSLLVSSRLEKHPRAPSHAMRPWTPYSLEGWRFQQYFGNSTMKPQACGSVPALRAFRSSTCRYARQACLRLHTACAVVAKQHGLEIFYPSRGTVLARHASLTVQSAHCTNVQVRRTTVTVVRCASRHASMRRAST